MAAKAKKKKGFRKHHAFLAFAIGVAIFGIFTVSQKAPRAAAGGPQNIEFNVTLTGNPSSASADNSSEAFVGIQTWAYQCSNFYQVRDQSECATKGYGSVLGRINTNSTVDVSLTGVGRLFESSVTTNTGSGSYAEVMLTSATVGTGTVTAYSDFDHTNLGSFSVTFTAVPAPAPAKKATPTVKSTTSATTSTPAATTATPASTPATTVTPKTTAPTPKPTNVKSQTLVDAVKSSVPYAAGIVILVLVVIFLLVKAGVMSASFKHPFKK